MRVPRELERFLGPEADAVGTVQTSLTRNLGTLWFVVIGGGLHAYEQSGLLSEPKPLELSRDAPLALEGEGLDRSLVVRMADSTTHTVKPWTWELGPLGDVIARIQAGGAPAPLLPEPVRSSGPLGSPPRPAPEPEPEPEPEEEIDLHSYDEVEPEPEPAPFRVQVHREPRYEARVGVPARGPAPRPRRRGCGPTLLAILALSGAAAAAWFVLRDRIFPEERCGDGVVQSYDREVEIEAPIVANIRGARGPVCDDGGSGSNGTFDVSGNGSAPEHGICQALGYERALSVTWGDGPGEESPVMPHASNWRCQDYQCAAGDDTTYDNCAQSEMLAAITCVREEAEACDAGPQNSDAPGGVCRTDCTPPRCGDGIVDPGEDCDDGNRVVHDACSNACQPATCGDGIRQAVTYEQCDDGGTADGDGCSATCQREAGTCDILVVARDATARANIERVLGSLNKSFDLGPAANEELDLTNHNFVIWYGQSSAPSLRDSQALAAYLETGGRLLLTGYDVLNRPTEADVAAGALVGLTPLGDGPWDQTARVANTSHAALLGPHGSFAPSTTLQVPESDHDRVAPVAGTTVILTLSDGTPKLTAWQGLTSGRGVAYFWNGNRYARDWATPGPAQSIFLNLLASECGVTRTPSSVPGPR